jgi:hypothetical protein
MAIAGIIISTLSFIIAVIALIQEMLHSRQILTLQKEKIALVDANDVIDQRLKILDRDRYEKNLKNYRRKITQDFEYINLGGLKSPILQFLPLEKVYVKQRMEYIPPTGMPKFKKNH